MLLAIGLAGYSLWGFIRASLNPTGERRDVEGLGTRLGYATIGVSYSGLFLLTIQFLVGAGNGQAGKPQDWTARLLHNPLGPWLVGIAGLLLLDFAGLRRIYYGYKMEFRKDFKSREMDAEEVKWAIRLGRVGYMARGLVFTMVGYFLAQSALHVNPEEAKGLDYALATLAQQPYGPWLLAVVALGLVAFGVFSIMSARWNYTTDRLRRLS